MQLSGATPSAPTLTGNSTTLCLVVRGENNIIYYRFYTIASQTWTGWNALPSGTTPDSPAATLVGNMLHVVVRGSDGTTLWYSNINPTTQAFSGWTLLDGSTPSTPTLTGNSTTLCLVVRGENNNIYYRFYTIASQTWTGWTALPSGTTPDTPAATIIQNTLYTVVRGSDGNSLWTSSINLGTSAFSGWTPLSGSTPTPTPTPTTTPTPTPTPKPTATPTPTTTPTSTTFGNTAIGANIDNNEANAQSISYFTSTTTGSITDIIAYIDGTTSGNAIAALYAVNGGSAGALLEQSKSVSIGTTFSWVDFQLPTPYTVTAGTTYGLAIMGNVPVNIVDVSGTGQRDHNGVSSYANGFKNPFGMIWGTDTVGAMSIYAASNLEPLSAFYADMNYGGYASLDTTVTHNGNPSIRVGPSDVNRVSREVDGAWINVNPGDHVYYTVWAKTDALPTSTDMQGGATFGFDLYISSNLGYGIASLDPNTQASHPTGSERGWGVNAYGYTQFGVAGHVCRIPWNTDWTLMIWDFTVPTDYYTYVDTTVNGVKQIGVQQIYSVNPVQINSMVTWFDARQCTDPANAWFANPQLYIIP